MLCTPGREEVTARSGEGRIFSPSHTNHDYWQKNIHANHHSSCERDVVSAPTTISKERHQRTDLSQKDNRPQSELDQHSHHASHCLPDGTQLISEAPQSPHRL